MGGNLVVGATSAMAEAWARIVAERGEALHLVGRDAGKLEAIAQDLRVRGASHVSFDARDLLDFDGHEALYARAQEELGEVDVVLVAHGTLGDQDACESDYALADRELKTNFLSVVSLLTPIANDFEARGAGTIAVIASVAGDRGRQSNYVYGAAKGGLIVFLQGLRNRLAKAGAHVVTIKPGFVDTPMTAHLDKGPLFVKPAVIAQGIDAAIRKRRDVVYLPFFWRFIMTGIRAIPETLFKRLSL